MTRAIEATAVSFTFPDGHQALSACTLAVDEGERIALLGPNGAGKTTFVLHLNGVLSPASGSIAIGGLEVTRARLAEIRRRVGIVFQDPDDQLFMPTVFEDVAFGPRNLAWDEHVVEAHVHRALAAVGMQDHVRRPPHHLSFGERRRIAVATVLAMDPDVLVLDEPSSNLDPAARRELADILTGIDITLLMVTHDLPYALELCSRAVIMNDGAIVADGAIASILGNADLMSRNRLELPYGFDPLSAGRR
jgi:cobalt/nickel transport system ATP-binding protein